MELSPELRAQYTPIIDGILSTADLDRISAKKIRQGLQAAVQHDISAQKTMINELIMTRFDKFDAARRADGANDGATNGTIKVATPTSAPTVNRIASSAAKRTSTSDSEDTTATPPPKKKVKKSGGLSDAELAARLQAEENSRARTSRSGGVGSGGSGSGKKARSTPVKKSKKKSAARITGSDDSDVDTGEEKPVKRNGAFHKPMNLSPALAALLGETVLSRPQTVKRIWEYVKERDLQNPNDKRQIRCDDAMRAVFKQDSVHMFTMNKILSNQLYPADE